MGVSFLKANTDRIAHDYYATPPRAVIEILKYESFSEKIWEPCCGGGHIAETLKGFGFQVQATDLFNYGYGKSGIDFLKHKTLVDADIVTNPPYIQAELFIRQGISLLTATHKLAMFLRLNFLETQNRGQLFEEYPPALIYVSSSRLGCAPNGNFKKRANGELYYPSSVIYAWFIWEYGYIGTTSLHWFN